MGLCKQKITVDLGRVPIGEVEAKFRLEVNKVPGKFRQKTETVNYYRKLSYTGKEKYINSLDE